MLKTTDNSDDDPTGDITRKILLAWSEGLSLRQISERVGLPIDVVNRSLKRSLKAIIGHGIKSHVQKNVS